MMERASREYTENGSKRLQGLRYFANLLTNKQYGILTYLYTSMFQALSFK